MLSMIDTKKPESKFDSGFFIFTFSAFNLLSKVYDGKCDL